ncbi:MAG: carboxypeptidase-like regulatory domain-containing protein, partial [Magnetococcus sp. YQC-9]
MRIGKKLTGFGLIVFTLLGMVMPLGTAKAASYDATGRWSVVFTPDAPNGPLAAGCLAVPIESFVATITQTDDTFTVSEFAGAQATGTITGEQYGYRINRPDGSVSDVSLTMASQNGGNGTFTTNWSNGLGGSCTATGSLVATRAQDSLFEVSGFWNVRMGVEQLDTTLSDPSCQAAPARTVQAFIGRDGNAFQVSFAGGASLSGDSDRAIHTYFEQSLTPQPNLAVTRLVMLNADNGAGMTYWSRMQDGKACSGFHTLNWTRDGVVVDPNGRLAIAPLNLSVGQTRAVGLAQVTGTAALTVSPESGIVTLETLGGVTTARCESEGQAFLTVTDAKDAATATVTCVSPATPGTDDDLLNNWLFIPDVTLVTRDQWRGAESGSREQRSVRWSRSGVAANFMNRAQVMTTIGDQGIYYTLNETGLTFHGERSFDLETGEKHRAFYGFKNEPSLDSGAAGITPDQIAEDNRQDPGVVLPARIQSGDSATSLRLEYELDSSNQPVSGRWSIVQQTIEVAGPLDLLAADLPEGLVDDSAFPVWRDAITDPALLSRLTAAIRLKVREVRYEPGRPEPVSAHGELYLARGFGIVYERWHEADGQSFSRLLGLEKGSGLVSMSARPLAARQWRIDGPLGTVLENAFVQLRVDHGNAATHDHETIGWVNETPNGNQALITLYDFADDDPADSTLRVRMTYGAKGYESQVIPDVDLSTVTPPVSLPLSSEQAGHPVNLFVKNSSGEIMGQASVRVSAVRDGQCASNTGLTRELGSSGSTTFTLANGAHCVEVWPIKTGDFIGGWYDASVPGGLINIVLPFNAPQGVQFTVTDALTNLVLIVSLDDVPNFNHVSGRLTDGKSGLANADILAFPANGATPLLFHTDGSGNFGFDLPTGAYVFAFRAVSGDGVMVGYLTAIDPNKPLSTTAGAAQYIYANALFGEITLTSDFKITTLTLSGTLSDGTTGHLTEPVVVTVRSTSSTEYHRIITDSMGAFTLQLLANQDYLVQFEAKGSGMLYRAYVDAFGNVTSDKASLSAWNLWGNTTLDVTIVDAMGVAIHPISGIVTVAGGTTPLAGVTVRAVKSDAPEVVVTTTTDAQGHYTLAVEAGSYKVGFFADGYNGGLAHGSGAELTLGGESAATLYSVGGSGSTALPLSVAMSRKSDSGGGNGTQKVTIRGDVSNSFGQALANVLVELLPESGQNGSHVELATAKTDGAGHYEAEIYPGSYRVNFRAVYRDAGSGALVQVPGVMGQGGYASDEGQVTQQLAASRLFEFTVDDQVNAILPNGVRITGLVTDAAGTGIAGVKVEFQPDFSETNSQTTWVETITDGDGRYEAFVMPEASYLVYFNTRYWDWQGGAQVKVNGLSGYAKGSENGAVSTNLADAKLYRFTLDQEWTINAQLMSGLMVQGVVAGTDGTPVGDVLVRLQPEWDGETGSSGSWGETYTDVTGHYEFSALPGKYRLEFLTSYWNWETQQSVNVGGGLLIGGFADGNGGVTTDWGSAKLYTIGASTEIPVNLLAGMTLSGRVANGEGKPAIGATVYVHDRDWSRNFHATVDEVGNFTVTVAPGVAYQVEAWPAVCDGDSEAPGCGEAFVPFTGGKWITQPDANWVTGWVREDATTRPVVVASGQQSAQEPIPGVVMTQNDPHFMTSLRMDAPLSIQILVEQAVQARGRVVDAERRGVPNGWIHSDFGDVPTDADGYFTLNIPRSDIVAQSKRTFTVQVIPGGYEDPDTHVWMNGDFVAGVVKCTAEDQVCRVTADEAQATGFGSDLASSVPWPFIHLDEEPNGPTGLLVEVSRGVSIAGTVVNEADAGVGNVWVHAWSYERGMDGGVASGSNGDYAIRLPTPEDGEVWYEVSVWSDRYLAPDSVLVKVTSHGVVGRYSIDPVKSYANGSYQPVALEQLAGDERGGVPVNFLLSSGKTIKGRVTDGENNGLAWIWVDVHTRDGSQWYGANT